MRAPKILSLLFLSVAWAEATHASKSIENAKPEIDKDSQRTYKESSGFERSRRQAYYDNRESVLRENEENDILDQIQTATATDLGSSFNFRAQFSQGYIDLGSRDLVEEGAATLAFVFDTTGSMTDDMQQVIVGAGEILNTVLEKFDRPIHNYVFVPFHDPGES
ncbi:Hemicentin-1 [Portunus trituberculatus]|uniref:Hemicentin-1 n=1 Tax=Portunus trituberculatus TaxID=210409 RepID=A0A5B7IN95_PORTR|nr:Hemicentin-1 [Portunus trituberculatus]